MSGTNCPLCGTELDGIIYTTNPPIHVWRCLKCGYQIDKGTIRIGKIEPKPKTNADKIRAMSDEELAIALLDYFSVFYAVGWSKDVVLDWLREEASE